MNPEEIVIGTPEEVRRKYNEFYKTMGNYPDWEDKWQLMVETFHEKKRKFVIEYIVKRNHRSLCDLGTGTGILLKQLRDAGFKGKLYAVDINTPPRLRKFAKEADFGVIKADFREVEIGPLDAVIFFSALHFASISQVDKIIKNLRVPRDFYQVDAFIDFKENENLQQALTKKSNGEGHLFRKDEIVGLFKRNGYDVKHAHEFPVSEDPMGRRYSFIHYSLE